MSKIVIAKGIVSPDRIETGSDAWRHPTPVEFFVDFETVSSINDSFADVKKQGGHAMIFQIGCLWYSRPAKKWVFRQWTADRLDDPSEVRIINGWVSAMKAAAAEVGASLGQCRVGHYSAAEVSFLETAYNAARKRLGKSATWPDLPWFDFLTMVIRKGKVNVRGAFSSGLKSVGKAMKRAGLTETDWADGPTDGPGAMVGAWWCDAESRRLGCKMADIQLMKDIGSYNRVDVKVMQEVIDWLRANR